MIDFNCDCAQEYGIYKNERELELANFVSSINISAGFHAGDPVSIKKCLDFATNKNIAIGAHIGYCDIQGFGSRKIELNEEELETTIIYQIGAINSFAQTFNLRIEHVRLHGAMKEELNTNLDFARQVARAIRKFNPWLTLFVNNAQTKEILEKEEDIKCAYEVNFSDYGSMSAIEELEIKPDTIHFNKMEDVLEARKTQEPTPVNYNRVGGQL